MQSVKHSNPYKVTWIGATSIDVQERCQIFIQFVTYTDNVWCDILPMDVGHNILGRPGFDLDESRGSYFNWANFRENSKTVTTSQPSFNRTLPTPSKYASSSSSVKLAGSSGAKPITSERRTVSEPGKINPRTQCYRCQGYGHLASQCPS